MTWRISGLFRDLFPAQIALIDAAVRAIAARDETDDENPLAAACRAEAAAGAPLRIFGTAPGAYGAGVEDLIGARADRAAIGAAYLASASHAYGGAEGAATRDAGSSPRGSRPPTCWCMRATIPAAICSKAPRMPPSWAASRRRPRRSAARPT